METNVVKVKLWGMDVGYLSWDKKAGVAIFEYEPSFVELGLDITPLTMPIDSPRSRKQMPWTGDKDKLYQGLPPMIADSLPDKWGNSLFKAWLRDNNIPTKKTNPVDHLSFIGSRAMGALEYEPAQKLGDNAAFSVDVQRLYEFQHYILKYDDNSAYPFAKLEYIYYRIALDAGIEMMPSELRVYGGITHFFTQC
jgi:serine/threonine-protein kinase HipA